MKNIIILLIATTMIQSCTKLSNKNIKTTDSLKTPTVKFDSIKYKDVHKTKNKDSDPPYNPWLVENIYFYRR